MIDKDIQLKNDVMNRVSSIHFMRTVARPIILEVVLFVFAIGLMSSLVSIPSIIQNMTQADSILAFIYNAFLNTKVAVQVIISLIVILGILFAQEVYKNVRYTRMIER